MEKRSSIKDIKAQYPNEWILLENPELGSGGQGFISGIVVYHSADKREMTYYGKPLLANYETAGWFFNRITPREKRNVIASLFYPVKV